jgi:hypothetical protein
MDNGILAFNVPQLILDQMYLAMYDSRERLEIGTENLTQCITWLELERGYKRPTDTRVISDE